MKQPTAGVALIIALILVALATILATKLTFDGFLERRRTIGVLAAEQALHFGLGAEALAARCARAGFAEQRPANHLGRALGAAHPAPAHHPPGRSRRRAHRHLAGGIGRHAGPLQSEQPGQSHGPAAIRISRRFRIRSRCEQFQRLLALVGLEPKWAAIARDWIDADDVPGSPDGAEDQVYTSQIPPYRTGNWPMMSPSELMNLPGFGADRYRKIAPYVTALPSSTVPINICTAPAPVLESLAPTI